MAGYGEGARYITDKYIKLAILDTESARARLAVWRRRWLQAATLIVALAASASAALVWGQWL
jgi:hypothetical protein